MTAVYTPSQSSLNNRGIKRKRAGGIAFTAGSVSEESFLVENKDEEYNSDLIESDGDVSEQTEDGMNLSATSRKKRLRVGDPFRSSSSPTKKKYHCTYEGCTKSYTKPARLEEHKRSHTGEVRTHSVYKWNDPTDHADLETVQVYTFWMR